MVLLKIIVILILLVLIISTFLIKSHTCTSIDTYRVLVSSIVQLGVVNSYGFGHDLDVDYDYFGASVLVTQYRIRFTQTA